MNTTHAIPVANPDDMSKSREWKDSRMPNRVTEKSLTRDRVVCLGYSLTFGMLSAGLLPGLIILLLRPPIC